MFSMFYGLLLMGSDQESGFGVGCCLRYILVAIEVSGIKLKIGSKEVGKDKGWSELSQVS